MAAMSYAHLGILCSTMVAALIAGRIAFLFLYRQPLLGRLGHRDYGGPEERLERHSMIWSGGESSGWGHPTDSIPFRDVCARAHYSYNGCDYSNDVTVTVVKGWGPGDQIQLWIDPVDPDNVTARGPSYWMCWLFLPATLGVISYHLPF